MSEYRMQIVHVATGEIVKWRAGHRLETDLIEDVCQRVKERAGKHYKLDEVADAICASVQAKGVGLMSSEAKVLAAIRAAFAELPYEVRESAQSASLQNVLREAFASVLWDLKSKV